MDSKKICCAAKNFAAAAFTKTNIAIGTGLAAVTGFAQEATETTSMAVQLPAGVDLSALMTNMAQVLGGVVAVALTIWAGFKIVKVAKSWLAGGVRG